VLRDIDLIKQFSQGDVGITITTINDDLRKEYEPRSSSIEERLLTIKELKECGMHTWAFIGPIMPFITDRNLDNLINKLAKVNVDYVAVDKLRLKPGLWRNIEIFLTKHYPELIPEYKEIFWSKSDYFECVKGEIEKMCEKFGVRFSG
jgi:DNA repair photolyase